MKYLVLIPDGMADEPVEALGMKTPMQAANKPTMDLLARDALVGTVSNIPEGMVPESDTANMAILSFDPAIYSHGRSPLEAMSMGLTMDEDDTAIRCNVVTLSDNGEAYEDKIIIDHSAGEISTEEADELIRAVDAAFGNEIRRFHTGISYRHCVLWKNADEHYPFERPHDHLGECIRDYLPKEENGGGEFYDLMKKSFDLLNNHPINEERRRKGLRPANSLWFWSPGKKPFLPSFKEKWGLDGAVISAVDLIKGIGICADMEVIHVEGATGNYRTNYTGKADAAIAAFERGSDLVYVHVEGPDECGHCAEIEHKVASIELIDEKILSPILSYLQASGEDYAVMILPDHPTPLRLRTHTSDPVPFLIYDSRKKEDGVETFDEFSAREKDLFVPKGHQLLRRMLRPDEPDEDDSAPAPQKKEKKVPSFGKLFEYVELFALSICIVFLAFAFLFKVCDVRGDSMQHTLYEGERLLISNLFYTPERGDVIVFHETGRVLNEPVVKRVIATGGEYVSLEFLENPQRIVVRIYDGNMQLKQVLDESAYMYIDQEAVFRKSDYENPIYVPEGYLFVMGDNRNHSTDSRSTLIGLVDERSVLGKVIARISPIEKFGAIE